MKKFIKRTLLGSSLALVTFTPVIAAVTETATLNVTSNVQQTIAIYVKAQGGTDMASGVNGVDTPGTLNFGNVDGFGYRTGIIGVSGIGSVVGVNNSTGAPENPGTGSTTLTSALYVYGGHSTTERGIGVYTRIQGSGSPTAQVTASEPNDTTDQQKVYLAKSDADWSVGGGWLVGDGDHRRLTSTALLLAGPGAFTGWGAVTDGIMLNLDLALRVYPSNTVGAQSTTTKFFATGY
jgi:hypothetical protein